MTSVKLAQCPRIAKIVAQTKIENKQLEFQKEQSMRAKENYD